MGALVVPVSYRSLTSEVAYLVDDSGATALFYDDAEVVDARASGAFRAPGGVARR